MSLKNLFLSLIITTPSILAAPTSLIAKSLLKSTEGERVPDSYIVVLKDGTDGRTHVREFLQPLLDQNPAEGRVGYYYETTLNGYSGTFSRSIMNSILDDPAVDYVAPDSIATISTPSDAIRPLKEMATDVVCEMGTLCTPSATGRRNRGRNVDVYSLDTGVYIEHNDFGGRAQHGASFGPWESQEDGNGHGTHTASTAAGTKFGQAPAASIIAVKVLSDEGSGSYSGIIAGIEWITRRAASTGKPSIINASLGGPRNDALDQAVERSIRSGVHFVSAAGNSGIDAETTSPAHVRNAVTVGAVDRDNRIAYFSNFGAAVDVFALGVNVEAAWIGGPNETRYLSGTSMAAPAVAGIMATTLSKYGSMSPAQLQEALKEHARHAVIGQPPGTTDLLATVW